MDKGAQFGIEDEDSRLHVAEKLTLNGKPGSTGSDPAITTPRDNVKEVAGEVTYI